MLEPFAHTVGAWLPADQAAVGAAVDGLRRTLAFLRSAGLVHFGAHPLSSSATVTTGTWWTSALVDEEFALDEDERAFLRRHRHYDSGELLAGLGSVLLTMLHALDPPTRQRVEHRYAIAPPIGPDRALQTLLGRLDDVAADSDLGIDGCMVTYLPLPGCVLYMATFLSELRRNPAQGHRLRDAVLRSLLEASDVPP